MTRIYLHTFGCKANQYDTEVLRQALRAAGATPVVSPADADVSIVNSCTVTHVSESKMRTLVRRIAKVNPERASVIVIGCAATVDDGTIQSIPGVADVIGGTDPDKVLRSLGLPAQTSDPVLRVFERGSRAWMKIQDGCDEHCTYCATRFARGNSVSRRPGELLAEAEALAAKHAEIVLTGVNIGSYGRDFDPPVRLADLVLSLVEQISEVRFRLSSIEGTQLDDRIVDLFADSPDRLAPHVHAPLQSGSDRILKLMGRRWYTASEYVSTLNRLAERLPALGIGADIIVGFPGETDSDFAATRALVEEVPFTYLHVFPYSSRPVAPSSKMTEAVHPDAVKERSSELRELVDQKRRAYISNGDGQSRDVVLLSRSGGRFEGLTEDYLTVNLSTDMQLPSRFVARLEIREETLWADPLLS